MGSKNNPGAFDCYANADPDEPMFVLLGRDAMAPMLVRLWAKMRRLRGESTQKVQEAMDCADKMDDWLIHIGKQSLESDFELLFVKEAIVPEQEPPNAKQLPKPQPNILRGTTEVQIKEFLSHAKSITEWCELAAQVRRRNHGVLPGDVEGDFFLRLRASWDSQLRD